MAQTTWASVYVRTCGAEQYSGAHATCIGLSWVSRSWIRAGRGRARLSEATCGPPPALPLAEPRPGSTGCRRRAAPVIGGGKYHAHHSFYIFFHTTRLCRVRPHSPGSHWGRCPDRRGSTAGGAAAPLRGVAVTDAADLHRRRHNARHPLLDHLLLGPGQGSRLRRHAEHNQRRGLDQECGHEDLGRLLQTRSPIMACRSTGRSGRTRG